MKTDTNKYITYIEYNHLNLPTHIVFSGQQASISYVYDATGTKLKKTVSGSGIPSKTTAYAGNYIYENEELQFFSTPEGYATPNSLGGFEYIYQHKDHLGNVRLSYTKNSDTSQEIVFTNSFENMNDWDNSENSFGRALTALDSSKKKSGTYSGRIDPISDTNDYYVNCDLWTPVNNAEDTFYTFSAWMFLEDVANNSAEIFLMTRKAGETGYPTGVHVSDNVTQTGQWVYIEKSVNVPSDVKELNIRIDNNHEGKVWFDDVKITKGNAAQALIVEESNYYPFGLKHKGYNNVVSSNGNSTAQKFKYNGVELEESLGLNLYEMDFRQYDPAIARFNGIDPVTHWSMSTYTAFDNNPVYWADPSGADSQVIEDLNGNKWTVDCENGKCGNAKEEIILKKKKIIL